VSTILDQLKICDAPRFHMSRRIVAVPERPEVRIGVPMWTAGSM
jgi:hypothetical protein